MFPSIQIFVADPNSEAAVIFSVSSVLNVIFDDLVAYLKLGKLDKIFREDEEASFSRILLFSLTSVNSGTLFQEISNQSCRSNPV
jgi:hypothetical protein